MLGCLLRLSSTELLSNLDYTERRSREFQLRNTAAKEESFSWIWSIPSFLNWFSNHEAVYWISGKPASGKSTLINYLVYSSQTKSELNKYSHLDWILLRFFFDFRGGKGITNSFKGLLKSILYQFVEAIPQVNLLGLDDKEYNYFSDWPEHRPRDALRTALKIAETGVCIFVDGLDEYEGSVLQIIQYLKGLAADNDCREISTKICLSSRPEPIPTQLL